MSSSILRRNSSKQGLQNLQRVTAQRSVEDAEEVERERRRRARQRTPAQNGPTGPGEAQPSGGYNVREESISPTDFKPVHQSALEEDEGFSDWTQRLEKRRQRRLEDHIPTDEEDSPRQNGTARYSSSGTSSILKSAHHRALQYGAGNGHELHREEGDGGEEEEDWRTWRKGKRDDDDDGDYARKNMEVAGQKDMGRENWYQETEDDLKQSQVKAQSHPQTRAYSEDLRTTGAEYKVEERKKPLRISFTSKLVLQQELRYTNGSGLADGGEVTPHLTISKISSTAQSLAEENEVLEAAHEREVRLQGIRLSHQQKEQQELEELWQRGEEAQEELDELNRRREERRRSRQEEDRRREEEMHLQQAREEEERQRMREEIERRRLEATERRLKHLSTSSMEEEPFSPISSRGSSFKNENEERVSADNTYSITERTDSLNRSLQKSNSMKKAQPPVPVAKIDNRLEQYNQAIEISSKEAKAAKQALVEIPSIPEPVASKKSLFEGGEAWNQSCGRTGQSKDAEEVKVAVADLITKWRKGGDDGGVRASPQKQAEVKPGDVLSKKNLWENIGDPPGITGTGGRNTPCGKKYKFVKTRHGKYEKIAIDDDYTFAHSGEDL